MKPIIRNVRPEDADVIKFFVKEHMVSAYPEIPYAEMKERAEADIERHCASPNSFVLELDGKVIGYLSLSMDTDRYTKRRIGVVHMVHVAEEYRGEGYANMLMEKADEFFEKNHIEHRDVSVNVNNEAAVELYKKHGYKPWRCTMRKVSRPEQTKRKHHPV